MHSRIIKLLDPILCLRSLLGTRQLREIQREVAVKLHSCEKACLYPLLKDSVNLVKAQLGPLSDINLLPKSPSGGSSDLYFTAKLNQAKVFLKVRIGESDLYRNEYEKGLLCASLDSHFIKPIGFCSNELLGILIFPYIDGVPLNQIWKSLSKTTQAFVRDEISSISAFLKHHRLEHRDIHEKNILFQLQLEPRIYLIDLEFMREIGEDREISPSEKLFAKDRRNLVRDDQAIALLKTQVMA